MADLVLEIPPGIIDIEPVGLQPGWSAGTSKVIFDTFPPGWSKNKPAWLDIKNFGGAKESAVLTVNNNRKFINAVTADSVEFIPGDDASVIGDEILITLATDEYPSDILNGPIAGLSTGMFTNYASITTIDLNGNNLRIDAFNNLASGYFTATVADPGSKQRLMVHLNVAALSATSVWEVGAVGPDREASPYEEQIIDTASGTGWYAIEIPSTPHQTATSSEVWLRRVGGTGSGLTIEFSEIYIGEYILGWRDAGASIANFYQRQSSGSRNDWITVGAESPDFVGHDGSVQTSLGSLPYALNNGGVQTKASLLGGQTDATILAQSADSSTNSNKTSDWNGSSWSLEGNLAISGASVTANRGAAGTTSAAFNISGDYNAASGNNTYWDGTSHTTKAVSPGSGFLVYNGGTAQGASRDDVFMVGTDNVPATSSSSWDGTSWTSETGASQAATGSHAIGSGSTDYLLGGGSISNLGQQTYEYWNGTSWAASSVKSAAFGLDNAYAGGQASTDGFVCGGTANPTAGSSQNEWNRRCYILEV